MSIHLQTTCRVAKSFAVKREKQADDSEIVVAHLKISELLIDRDQIDELLRQPIGWSTRSLFDEFGAPLARLTLTLGGSPALSFTGSIDGGKKSSDPKLRLNTASIDGVTLELTKLGALLAFQLSWTAAGDEVDDIADMLGLTCNVVAVIEDGGQKDLLAPLQSLADKHGHSMTIEADGKTLLEITPKGGEDLDRPPFELGLSISSASEVMAKLQKGWSLCGASPEYWLENPTRTGGHGVWLNAAKSVLKRGLEPVADDSQGDTYGRWIWKDKERAS